MFGLFRSRAPASPVRTAADLVYFDTAAAADAVVAAVRDELARGHRVALLTPFAGHVPALIERLAARGLTAAPVRRSVRDAGPAPGAIPVADYGTLALMLAELAAPVCVLQLERHPLRAHDLAAERTLEAHSPQDVLRVYLSLDDGLLRLFGSLKQTMTTMGLPPGEAVQHPWVTRAIEKAQAKLAKRVKMEVAAESFDAWCASNLAR